MLFYRAAHKQTNESELAKTLPVWWMSEFNRLELLKSLLVGTCANYRHTYSFIHPQTRTHSCSVKTEDMGSFSYSVVTA